MMISDQEIPFPRVSENWGWGQRVKKTGQGECGGGGLGWGEGNKARKGSKSHWLSLSLK